MGRSSERIGIQPKRKNGETKDKKSLQELLGNVSKTALESILLQLAAESPALQHRLELEFGASAPVQEQKECRQLIRTTIRKNSDRAGYVTYRLFPAAAEGAHLVAQRTQKHLDGGKYNQAFHCALTLLQEMMRLLEHADSSSGELGDLIGSAMEMLKESVSGLMGKERDSAFRTLQKEVLAACYDGWSDEQIELMGLLVSMTVTASERQTVEALMQELISREAQSEYSSRYMEEKLALLKLNLHQRFDGEMEALRYLTANKNFPEFRKRLIGAAIEAREYIQAERYCMEGEEHDRQYAGLVSDWRRLRAEVYHQSGQIEAWQDMLREFAAKGDVEAMKALKESLPGDIWAMELPGLLDRMKAAYGYLNPYPEVLIAEQLWDRLLEYVTERPGEIIFYGKDLVPHYPDETRVIYVQHVRQAAAEAGNRNQYRNICKLLLNLAALCGREAAHALILEFQSTYPNRTAMQDELSKIRF